MKAVFSCSCVCSEHRIYSFTNIRSTNKRPEIAYVPAGFTLQIIPSRSSDSNDHTHQKCFQFHLQYSGGTTNPVDLPRESCYESIKSNADHPTPPQSTNLKSATNVNKSRAMPAYIPVSPG